MPHSLLTFLTRKREVRSVLGLQALLPARGSSPRTPLPDFWPPWLPHNFSFQLKCTASPPRSKPPPQSLPYPHHDSPAEHCSLLFITQLQRKLTPDMCVMLCLTPVSSLMWVVGPRRRGPGLLWFPVHPQTLCRAWHRANLSKYLLSSRMLSQGAQKHLGNSCGCCRGEQAG